jgi:hypothetical protein
MPVERQPPDVLAMILADTVLQDLVTGRLTIKGTISSLLATEFPVDYAFVVYTAITSGHGPTDIELRMVDVDDEGEPLFTSQIRINFADPLAVVERVFGVSRVTFAEPGEYRVQLFGAGHLLRERRLQVGSGQPPPST